MSALVATDPCSLESLHDAARRAYGEARAAQLQPSLERTAAACAALRDALDPRTEPALAPAQERER